MDELEKAEDILTSFEKHWGKAGKDPTEQQHLLHLIVERIWIKKTR